MELLATLELGLGSTHGHYLPQKGHGQCSFEGGGSLDHEATQPRSRGAVVIDKRTPLEKNMALAFNAPLLDTRLAEGAVSSIADDILPGGSMVADAVAGERGNAYGALVRGARAGAVNLGSVGLRAYVAFWRDNGARIGMVRGGVVVWDTD